MIFDPVDPNRQIEFNEANIFLIRAVPLNADPVEATDLKDGDIWYRGDLNSFKAKVNGTIQTLVPVPGNIISGTFGPFDVGGTTGALTVGGDIISAVASIPAGSESSIVITYPSVGSNFVPLITIEGTGNPSLDGDLKAPIVHTLTDTSLTVHIDELAPTNSLRFHVLLWPVN